MNAVVISKMISFNDYQCDCFCFWQDQDKSPFVLHAGKKSVRNIGQHLLNSPSFENKLIIVCIGSTNCDADDFYFTRKKVNFLC